MRDFYYFFLKFILVFPFENLTNFFMMDMHLRLYDAPRWKRITKDFMQGSLEPGNYIVLKPHFHLS